MEGMEGILEVGSEADMFFSPLLNSKEGRRSYGKEALS